MSTPPTQPSVFHITHVSNLPRIIASRGLFSDAMMIAHGGPQATIGMPSIKQRRLTLPVHCCPGLHVGDCVPFYFCPRSVMLYVLHRGNSPGLSYSGGQEPIVHLEADLHAVVNWANSVQRRWAFSLSNAGAIYVQFRNDLTQLADINWSAVAANDFRDAMVKEGKQAEFLLQESFPWELVRRIGVSSATMALNVQAVIANAAHQPQISVEPSWYF